MGLGLTREILYLERCPEKEKGSEHKPEEAEIIHRIFLDSRVSERCQLKYLFKKLGPVKVPCCLRDCVYS